MQQTNAGDILPSIFFSLHIKNLEFLLLSRNRPMTRDEKRRLGQNIGKMSPEDVNQIIQILREMNGSEWNTSAEQLEFDLDAQVSK